MIAVVEPQEASGYREKWPNALLMVFFAEAATKGRLLNPTRKLSYTQIILESLVREEPEEEQQGAS